MLIFFYRENSTDVFGTVLCFDTYTIVSPALIKSIYNLSSGAWMMSGVTKETSTVFNVA